MQSSSDSHMGHCAGSGSISHTLSIGNSSAQLDTSADAPNNKATVIAGSKRIELSLCMCGFGLEDIAKWNAKGHDKAFEADAVTARASHASGGFGHNTLS